MLIRATGFHYAELKRDTSESLPSHRHVQEPEVKTQPAEKERMDLGKPAVVTLDVMEYLA